MCGGELGVAGGADCNPGASAQISAPSRDKQRKPRASPRPHKDSQAKGPPKPESRVPPFNLIPLG